MNEPNPLSEKCSITLIDPNAENPLEEEAPYQETSIPVKQVFLRSEVPDDYGVIGYRAFFDVYYKSDMISYEGNKLYFAYDFENQRPFKEITDVPNYVNTAPLGVSVKVEPNTDDFSYALSLNGFLHEIDELTKMDVYLANSFVQGLTEDVYCQPYIEYTPEDFGVGEDDKEDFTCTPFYYMPKDKSIIVNYVAYGKNTSPQPEEYTIGKVGWYTVHKVTCNDVLCYVAHGCVLKGMKTIFGAVPSLDEINIPHEKYHEENVDRLVNALTPHKLFNNSDNVREALRRLFTNGKWLDKTMTEILEFFDNTVNVDKCHVEYLVSLLNSMGEDTSNYSVGAFNAVNEIRDFARIATMNHSELIGHENIESYDISFNGEIKGKNVGDEMKPTDLIFADKDGYVAGFLRNEKFYKVSPHVPLVLYDKYTKQSRTVSFHNIPTSVHYEGNEKFFDDNTSTENTVPFVIGDYSPLWGWNMLLPDRYYTPTLQRDIVENYYRFFLLDPKTSVTRQGNFLDEDTIDGSVLNVEKWDGRWETMYKVFQKLLLTHGQFIGNDKDD